MILRLASRRLYRSPWYSTAVLGVIALTVALSATVFAVVDGVLFKPLPFPQPHRLYLVSGIDRAGDSGPLSIQDVRYLAEAKPGVTVTPVASSLLALRPDRPDLNLYAGEIGAEFFDVVGVRPLFGGFLPEHFTGPPTAGVPRPAIIAYRWWDQWFGRDPQVVGRVMDLPGGRILVVGVLPRDFVFPRSSPNDVSVLVPMFVPAAAAADRWTRSVSVAVVRLDQGLSVTDAKASLDAALATRTDEYSPTGGSVTERYLSTKMTPATAALTTLQRPVFSVAFGITMVLLVLGALNVTAIMFSQARGRRQEFGLYAALGASRLDLARLWLSEAGLVALIGGLVGVAAAHVFLPAAVALLPPMIPLLKPPVIDFRVVMFALGAATIPVLLTSVLPVITLARRTSAELSAAATGRHSGRSGAHSALLAVETALGCVAVVAGSLVVAGFLLLRSEDPGFDTTRLGIIEPARITGEAPEARQLREASALGRLREVPGVRDVATVGVPLFERLLFPSRFQPTSSGRTFRSVHEIPVAGPFFQIAGLTLREGRFPTAEELDRGDPIAVVSDRVARAYWPDVLAPGQVLKGGALTVTVIGVVESAQIGSQWRQDFGQVYFSAKIATPRRTVFLVHTDGNPQATVTAAANALRQDIPGLLVRRAESLDRALLNSEPVQRFAAWVFSVAATLAILLVAAGIFGLIAIDVVHREREIGIRTALGSSASQVMTLMIRTQLWPVLVGVGGGLLASWWTARLVQGYLYRFDAHDPRVWTTAVAVLLVVAVLAAWLPARRATRVDPLIALKAE